MDDNYLTENIKNTKFLSDATKKRYLKNIEKIQTKILPKSLEFILKNPTIFDQKVKEYAANNKGRVGKTLGQHYIDALYAPIIAIFLYNQDLKEQYFELYNEWKKLHENVRKPINDKYSSNEPTERQIKAYVPFEEVIQIRNALPVGSPERLLLMLYTEIPPVRANYNQTRIVTELTPEMDEDDENLLLLLEGKSYIILKKYKTAKTYGVIYIQTTPKLHEEIIDSLIMNPREYLFMSSNGTPFYLQNSFDQWANRKLKEIFEKKEFSLTMLRHIFISRRDLKLEEKSGLEQEQIARIMGHSTDQQRKYLWHSWLKKMEMK